MKLLTPILFYGACVGFGLFNLGTKLYTRDPGPLVDNFQLSCMITVSITAYFFLSLIRAITVKR